MRRMHGVHEQHGLVGAKRIQKFLISFDERLLLFRIELAPDRLGLAVFESPSRCSRAIRPERLS